MFHTPRIYEAFGADYDALQGPLAEACWEAGIIRELASHRHTSGRVFDAGAGTGIGARKLLAFGTFEVTSCDQSSAMLRQAAPFSSRLLRADIATLPALETQFDLIVSGFDALNYLRPEQLAAFFVWASTHLVGNGLLIFDYSSPALLRDKWHSCEFVEGVDTLSLRRRHHYDAEREHAVIELECFQEGQERWRETHFQYSVDSDAMARLAQASGLIVHRVRNLSGDSYSPESDTHVYVLGRRGIPVAEINPEDHLRRPSGQTD